MKRRAFLLRGKKSTPFPVCAKELRSLFSFEERKKRSTKESYYVFLPSAILCRCRSEPQTLTLFAFGNPSPLTSSTGRQIAEITTYRTVSSYSRSYAKSTVSAAPTVLFAPVGRSKKSFGYNFERGARIRAKLAKRATFAAMVSFGFCRIAREQSCLWQVSLKACIKQTAT